MTAKLPALTHKYEIAEYKDHLPTLEELHEKFGDVVHDVSNAKGMKAAKEQRKEVRDVRYAVQKLEKEVLKPYQDAVKEAQARVKAVKSEAALIYDVLKPLEDAADNPIKDEEAKKKRIKEAAEKAKAEEQAKLEAEAQEAQYQALGGEAEDMGEHNVDYPDDPFAMFDDQVPVQEVVHDDLNPPPMTDEQAQEIASRPEEPEEPSVPLVSESVTMKQWHQQQMQELKDKYGMPPTKVVATDNRASVQLDCGKWAAHRDAIIYINETFLE